MTFTGEGEEGGDAAAGGDEMGDDNVQMLIMTLMTVDGEIKASPPLQDHHFHKIKVKSGGAKRPDKCHNVQKLILFCFIL